MNGLRVKNFFVLVLCVLCECVFAQDFHRVAPKETPYSISRMYGLSLEQFYDLNPGRRDNVLDIGEVLAVSERGKIPTEKITVQQGQTLYSISKAYKISFIDLRKLNPQLNENLYIGQEIVLPLANIKYAEDYIVEYNPNANIINPNEYLVQPKDTYYGITRKFNISQEELFRINPNLRETGLHPGAYIVIKETEKEGIRPMAVEYTNANVSLPISNEEDLYTVKQGDTVFGILNRFGIGLDYLLSLNPDLSNGLKIGMKLKIKDVTIVKQTDDALNIALILPFGFDSGVVKYREMALDFLTGAKLAIERNVAKGRKLNLNIIDEGGEHSLQTVMSSIDKNNTDIIVGPFFKSGLVELISYVSSERIPIVSPFANSEDLQQYSSLVIVETDPNIYAERIANEVLSVYNGEKIYIVGNTYAVLIQKIIGNKIGNASIEIIPNSENIQLEKSIMTGELTPVIAVLASDDEKIKTSFANKIVSLNENASGIKAFSMFFSTYFEEIEEKLGKVRFVYIVDRIINTEGDFEREILSEYDKKYCKKPSKYSVIGFDIINDILERGGDSKGQFLKNIDKTLTHLATKFEYKKTRNGAYVNNGYRVVRLNP